MIMQGSTKPTKEELNPEVAQRHGYVGFDIV
jgi:hypothetical protein